MAGLTLDIFNQDAFSVMELTDAINIVPNKFGRLQQLGLFQDKPIRVRDAAIERKDGVLNLLPTVPVGGPATLGSTGRRNMVKVTVPHIPHQDSIMAEEVAAVRSFGSENALQSVQELVVEKLATMTDKHDITLENLKWGALRGEILDADGSSLLNLHNVFGTAEQTIDFDLDNASVDMLLKMTSVSRYMELNLKGAPMSGVHIFADSDFFDRFITHASIKDAYKYFTSTQNPLREDTRRMFRHAGVTIEEHVGSADNAAGTNYKFVPTSEAIAVPLGTGLFKTYFAPASFIETVNTPGKPRYAKQELMKFGKGVDIYTESNPLPICLRPELCVRLTRT